MANTHELSQAAYDRLSAELNTLTSSGRLEIAEKIEAARELGDLKENGDYHAAKDEQGKMEARIGQIAGLLEDAVVVGDDGPIDAVRTGVTGSLRYEGDDEIDRIPYMAPSLVGDEKAARGKTPTDTWWHTIVSPNGHEKTGYPTQKPLAILERIVQVHSEPGDVVLDFFAGSGTTGEAAAKHGRGFVLIDESRAAVRIMERRLARDE